MMEEKDILKDYVKNNIDLLPLEELPSGDLERFESACSSHRNRIKFHRRTPRRKSSFLRVVILPVAASLFVIMLMNLFTKTLAYPTEQLTCIDVYAQHYQKVGTLVGEISALTAALDKADCQMYEAVVESVIYEPVSIIDLIPEYMPEDEKVAIINEYSETVCGTLEDIIITINN